MSRRLKPVLQNHGLDVATAGDEGLLARPDSDVAAAAFREDRMIFTLDLEFGDLRKYPPGTHPGVILFRPASLGPLAVNQFVEDFVRNTDIVALAGCVAVVEPNRVRVRRSPLDRDTTEES